MNDNLFDKITIVIVLYEEEFELIDRCLENIKKFNIIIIDNAGNKKLKKQIQKKFNILIIFLIQKILVIQKQLIELLIYVIQNMFLFLKLTA